MSSKLDNPPIQAPMTDQNGLINQTWAAWVRALMKRVGGNTALTNLELSAASTGGTVTSVALSAPAEFSVGGSPVTTAGTLAVTKATQLANLVWAGPTTGAAGQPAFRSLVAADLPNTAVAPGSYTNANITVDQQGRLTAASSGTVSNPSVTSKTANYTTVATDGTVFVSGAGGAFTITLVTPVGNAGLVQRIVRTDNTPANAITLTGTGLTGRGLHTQGEAYTLQSDGTNWQILDHKTITPWTSFTPTQAWSANTATGFRRRVGDTMEIIMRCSAGAGLSSNPIFSGFIPSGWTVDTAKLPNGSGRLEIPGAAVMTDQDVGEYQGAVGMDSPYTTVFIQGPNGQDVWTPTVPNTWATGDVLDVRFSLPISGWTE